MFKPGILAATLTAFVVSISVHAQSVRAQSVQTTGATEIAPDGTTTTVETTTVRAAPPAPEPNEKPIPLLDQRTAYMVGKHTLKLGVLAFDYGIIQQVSIGSDPPAWALRGFVDIWVPNLHTKVQLLDRDPVSVAALVACYYGRLDSGNTTGNLINVPLSLFVSVKVHPRITLHGEGTYVYSRVFGTGNLTKAELDGATALRTAQAGLMVQFRLTRIFSLTATGRYQVYTSDLPLSGSSNIDPFTSATLSGQLVPSIQHPWQGIGGIAVLWKHFQLILGVGYGNYFAPGLDIADPTRGIVPDANLAVVL